MGILEAKGQKKIYKQLCFGETTILDWTDRLCYAVKGLNCDGMCCAERILFLFVPESQAQRSAAEAQPWQQYCQLLSISLPLPLPYSVVKKKKKL